MIAIRRATSADAEARTTLRGVMFEAMGRSGVRDKHWQACARRWFEHHLEDSAVASFVAQAETGGLVAAALGEVTAQPPSPSNPQGAAGRISNVVTMPEYRRGGACW